MFEMSALAGAGQSGSSSIITTSLVNIEPCCGKFNRFMRNFNLFAQEFAMIQSAELFIRFLSSLIA